jgi:hypothetical protein
LNSVTLRGDQPFPHGAPMIDLKGTHEAPIAAGVAVIGVLPCLLH